MLAVFRLTATLALFGWLAPSSAQPALGTFEGQVSDPSGAAISGAAVQVTGPDGSVRTSFTDIQGRYRFSSLAPGVYRILVTSGEFTPFTDSNIDVVAGAVHTLTVRLHIAESKQD